MERVKRFIREQPLVVGLGIALAAKLLLTLGVALDAEAQAGIEGLILALVGAKVWTKVSPVEADDVPDEDFIAISAELEALDEDDEDGDE